ncbi:hypothetical protein FHS13_003031 [Nocardiopsis algeriensis]|uniref:Uncharacterized protein n=1 Tax=Nocardiopsis algeriensis TaxID=1478215 RepID=A0A841IS78_9ACTN|nr:hypothetical protein [Nocardiopsis algeriensis]
MLRVVASQTKEPAIEQHLHLGKCLKQESIPAVRAAVTSCILPDRIASVHNVRPQ